MKSKSEEIVKLWLAVFGLVSDISHRPGRMASKRLGNY